MNKIIKIQNHYLVIEKISSFEVVTLDMNCYGLKIFTVDSKIDHFAFKYHTKEGAEADLNRLIEAIEGEDICAHWDGWICSNCGNEAPAMCNDGYYASRYCPNCGAWMENAEDDEIVP